MTVAHFSLYQLPTLLGAEALVVQFFFQIKNYVVEHQIVKSPCNMSAYVKFQIHVVMICLTVYTINMPRSP